MAGPDIFLSYNREDSARAKHFADAFAAEGLDVWWDVALRSGEAYDEVTENALRTAKAVVVLWSEKSVVSRWVRAEATLADRRKTLMPAMIEPCERPIMFELVQTAELSHWVGDAQDAAWQDFARHVREFVGQGGKPKSAAEPEPVKRTPPSKPSIAVLPFVNLSGDPEQEYFADGVVDDIISALTRFNQLFVIARSSSFTYKGRQVDYRTVADELGVRFVLEGSIRKAGNRLRISGQLVDTLSGEHLWADRVDGALEDVFDLQDRITEQVVGAIEPSIRAAEIVRSRAKRPESLDAYDLFLQAQPPLSKFSRDGFAQARLLLERALEIERDYPQALAAIAWGHEQARWFYSTDTGHDHRQNAADYARRALATGNEYAYVLAASALVMQLSGGNDAAAKAAKDRALLRNSNSAWVNEFCSLVETWTGNADVGLVLAEKACRLSPLDSHKFLFLQVLGEALNSLERWDEAVAVFESYIGDAPYFAPGLKQGAIAHAALGNLERAREIGIQLAVVQDGFTVSSFLERVNLPPNMVAMHRKYLPLAGLPE